MPRDLQYLLDKTDISDLLIDYGTAIDSRDFAALDRIFTTDAVIDYRATGGPRCTLEEARRFLAEALPQFPRSQHMMGNISIRLQGATATARTLCHNPMVMRKPDGGEEVVYFGIWYADELLRTGEGWRISSRSLEFCYSDNYQRSL
ncbi:MAG TPA: nuclear transport factor 2 family protein [Paraburkholderia sp.]